MNQNLSAVLFIGYFLSGFSHGRCVCEDLSAQFQTRGYKVIRTSYKTNRYFRVLDILITIIRKRKEYQVASVEVYNGFAFIWAELACAALRLLRKPYVVTLHGARMLQFAQRWPSRVRSLLLEADLVTTPSRLFQEKFSTWRPDIIYLPNAIDIICYPYRHKNTPAPKLAWLRKFETNYNPGMAIETINLLKRDFPDVKLIMGGSDPKDGSSDHVRNLINLYKLTDQVEFSGFVARPQIPQWFSRSDIYINTTTVESFGIAVMEAAACGLCIVTTNVGELSRLWHHEEDALLVSSDNPEEMAAAVKRILTEPGLAARLSANARVKAENYNWSTILPQWESLFANLVNND
jgi:glycosyltransferase involved in cell wall biosynthesis